MGDFKTKLSEVAGHTQDGIRVALSNDDSDVARAMVYATEGGKGLRGFFVVQSAALHGIEMGPAIPAACAIECIHAYSLVHDDMPLMDDDDLRRGRPTVHKAWDDVTAILAGDALQALAFELIGFGPLADDRKLALSVSLAQAAGVRGMVGGQAMDIAAETAEAPLTLDQIVALQAGKTGALLEWSCMAGAVMADADHKPLQIYGENVGLAFQIADDILDVEGDAATVGKAVGKDEGAGKATFVSHLGIDGAKRRAAELVDRACDALDIYGGKADTLREAARFVIARTH